EPRLRREALGLVRDVDALELPEALDHVVRAHELRARVRPGAIFIAGRRDEERDRRERHDDAGDDHRDDGAGHAPSAGDIRGLSTTCQSKRAGRSGSPLEDSGAQSDSRTGYSAWTRWPRCSIRARPPSSTSSITNAHSTISAPSCSSSESAAFAVPPVASRSSITSTRSPRRTASSWTSSRLVPYSSSYSWLIAAAGSLPGLRSGTRPAWSCCASAAPKMKPRASIPATLSTRPA